MVTNIQRVVLRPIFHAESEFDAVSTLQTPERARSGVQSYLGDGIRRQSGVGKIRDDMFWQ